MGDGKRLRPRRVMDGQESRGWEEVKVKESRGGLRSRRVGVGRGQGQREFLTFLLFIYM